MEKYRIENIQKAKLNRRNVKIFTALEYDKNQQAYVFVGKYTAPAKTADKNLINFI